MDGWVSGWADRRPVNCEGPIRAKDKSKTLSPVPVTSHISLHFNLKEVRAKMNRRKCKGRYSRDAEFLAAGQTHGAML